MKKISIVVPVYNAENYIGACIESIIAQTYKNWELLLINDGSKDASEQVCFSYTQKDSRIKLFNKENGGVSSARNTGISLASGEYITFIDSDDYVDVQYCEKLLENKTENVGMTVYGLQKVLVTGETRLIAHRLPTRLYDFEELEQIIVDDGTLSGFTIHSSCAVLYEMGIINKNKLRFNESVKYNEDGLFTVEYFLASRKAVYIDYNSAIYYYRTNEESATVLVNIEGERYVESMANIVKALEKYPVLIKTHQLERRALALFIARLIYLAQKKTLSGGKIKRIFTNELSKSIKYLNNKEMSIAKRVTCLVLKLHMFYLLSAMLNMKYGKSK